MSKLLDRTERNSEGNGTTRKSIVNIFVFMRSKFRKKKKA